MKNKVLVLSFSLISIFMIMTYFKIIPLIAFLYIVIILLLFTLLFVIYYQTKETNIFFEHLLDILDNTFNENSISYSNNDETIESKIQFKLNKLLDKIKNEANQSKKSQKKLQSLITDVSHQIKTPLTNIKLYSNMLKNEKNIENTVFYKNLDSQINKLEFLMEAIIKISRLENNIITIIPKSNNLKETIIKSILDVYYKAEKKGIIIKCDLKDYVAMYDEKWTIEAITNVLDNAIKYSNENDKIIIELKRTEFYCIVKIQDNGIGIDKEEFNNIFKRFYRETDKYTYEGIGIGLYLTREILSLEHGYISVESQKNIGSCFSLYLPITD
ncbi:sensor histidine kinase [Thomasclavelia sp.]